MSVGTGLFICGVLYFVEKMVDHYFRNKWNATYLEEERSKGKGCCGVAHD